MPAVPAIIMGGSAIGSALLGKKASDNASQAAQYRSPEETALLRSQTGLADQQRGQGAALFGQAMPAIQNTMRYYSTLLGGSRAARVAATSPEAESVSQAYGGADAALRRSNLRGGERDAQLAENQRAKAGQIARLVTGVRPQAAAGLGSQAMGLVGAGNAATTGAGALYSNLLGNATGNRLQANAVGQQAGQNTTDQIGRLVARIVGMGQGSWWGKSASGGGGGMGWGSGETSPEMG